MKNFMHLKHINFLGGEPLIVDEHYEFLKKCIKFEVAQNIILSYTTNLTVIKKELLGLWENFRHVSVGVSVDGVEKVNDYIRYPSKWKNIQKNVEKISTFKDNISMDLQIHSTFQLLNVFDYDKLLEWTFSLGDLGFWRLPFGNWVSYPEYYDAKLLPKDLKEVAIEKINKFLDSKKDVIWDIGEQQWLGIFESNLKTLEETFDEDDEQEYLKTIKKYTKLLDLNRGQHIKDYIPVLEKFIYE
jgi:MoaA/NifB/PqqE/SkfB family radical SAM enzyme